MFAVYLGLGLFGWGIIFSRVSVDRRANPLFGKSAIVCFCASAMLMSLGGYYAVYQG